MVGEMLSQEEINALLGGMNLDNANMSETIDTSLTTQQIDVLGEVGNISMGTAATTLFALLNHKVLITAPEIELLTINELEKIVEENSVVISVDYTKGLVGTNLLVMSEKNVKTIVDLMMQENGSNIEDEINEAHLGAISEAMNQMIGSSATSISQMIQRKIDVSLPEAIALRNNPEYLSQRLSSQEPLVKVSFRMQILENIIDSKIMQILPVSFAKELVDSILKQQKQDMGGWETVSRENRENRQLKNSTDEVEQKSVNVNTTYTDVLDNGYITNSDTQEIEVQQLKFPTFDKEVTNDPVGNMDVLLDVTLEVSVELGRTNRKIREILEFGPGTVIELDRLVGQPIDILANGKYIANGEVVVIDENFCIRITDIIRPENRI